MEKKRLVLIGGGHAHMMTLANIHRFVKKGYKVVVIGNSPLHYYSGMGPGLLGGTYSPEQVRFQTQHVVEKQGGEFILDKAIKVDPERCEVHLESGNSVLYDVLSFNTGSYVPRENVPENATNIFTVKPIERLQDAQRQILSLNSQKKASIGIVGGGPSAVEIAGNIWRLSRQSDFKPTIIIFAGKQLMSDFPTNLQKKITASLKNRGIRIVEGRYARNITPSQITLDSGSSYPIDLIFLAYGIRPSPIFKDSGLETGPDGALAVNRFLQSKQYPNLFGGGDCIYFEEQPLNKVGVYAVRQNPVLLHNLMAALDGSELIPFDPGGDYLLIFNMGDGTGVFIKRRLVFGGKLAFKFKDYLDRRFMTEFQSLE